MEEYEISIIGTDINEQALSTARSGIYPDWSFRNTPHWVKSSYFKPVDDQRSEIIPSIKKMVSFHKSNLISDNNIHCPEETEAMDIIFCRNVLMYFTREWAKKTSEKLSQCLSEGGWLAVTSCELSSGLFHGLGPVNFPGAVILRKIPLKAKKPEITDEISPVVSSGLPPSLQSVESLKQFSKPWSSRFFRKSIAS